MKEQSKSKDHALCLQTSRGNSKKHFWTEKWCCGVLGLQRNFVDGIHNTENDSNVRGLLWNIELVSEVSPKQKTWNAHQRHHSRAWQWMAPPCGSHRSFAWAFQLWPPLLQPRPGTGWLPSLHQKKAWLKENLALQNQQGGTCGWSKQLARCLVALFSNEKFWQWQYLKVMQLCI